MTAVSLFDTLFREEQNSHVGSGEPDTHLAELAAKLVASSLADLGRILEYEELSRRADPLDAALELEILRSVWQLFEQWAAEADQVFARVSSLKSAGALVPGTDQLGDAIGRTRARLSVTPEQTARAKAQIRQGQCVPLSELRNELAEKLVASSLADLERIREYEKLSWRADTTDPARELEILRSVWQLFEAWAEEADQVFARAASLKRAGFPVPALAQLGDGIGSTRARLSLTPEQIAKSLDQARKGQCVPAKELRDELHARIHR